VDVRSPSINVHGPPRRDRAAVAKKSLVKSVLVVDVGGTSVKILASGQKTHRSFPSGPKLTPKEMLSSVKRLAADWAYDAVSIGYPGPVLRGRPIARGWVGFDFAAAFDHPVKVINDAAMQALGSYRGGKMLFLGLGTGLGSAMIVDGIVEPMELGHLPYKKGKPTRITSAKRDLNVAARRNGGATLPTWWPASSRRWNPKTQCLEEATLIS
jgi:predicted NBD/HSP70 family sugar kinase